MKIIHCIASLNTGGAERTLVRLVNKCNKEHFIITILNNKKLESSLRNDIQVYSILPLSIKKIFRLNKQIKNINPDIFQGWMYHGDLLASF